MSSKLFRKAFEYRETRGTLITDKKIIIKTALDSIKKHRKNLEEYTRSNPTFLCTLEPTSISDAPQVVRLMVEASRKAGVGPMAAVAGVLADLTVQDMIEAGSKLAVVENGGEVSAISDRPIDVALSAGNIPLSNKMGFRLTDFPVGVATSSGLFSHALSFGKAEAATIFCKNAGLADATATAVANLVKGEDYEAAIQRGLEKALSIEGVEGALIMYKGSVGTAGNIPQIIKVGH